MFSACGACPLLPLTPATPESVPPVLPLFWPSARALGAVGWYAGSSCLLCLGLHACMPLLPLTLPCSSSTAAPQLPFRVQVGSSFAPRVTAPHGCLKFLRAAAATWHALLHCACTPACTLTPPGPSRGRAINTTPQHPAPATERAPLLLLVMPRAARVCPCCRPRVPRRATATRVCAHRVLRRAPGLRVPRPSCAASRRPPLALTA